MNGKLITFEGPNGTGKTFHSNILKESLQAKGIPTIVAREPGGVIEAELIREYLISLPNRTLKARDECELYYQSRKALLDELIVPNLIFGITVILDRFEDSTRVYQGYLGGVDNATLDDLASVYLNGIQPDLTFLLTTPYHVVKDRLNQQLNTNYDPADELRQQDYEAQSLAYGVLAKNYQPKRWRVISTNQSPEIAALQIFRQTYRLFQNDIRLNCNGMRIENNWN